MKLEDLRRWTFRMRGGIWTVLALAILFLGKAGDGFPVAGIIVVFLGQVIRFWAAGSIEGYRRETVNAGFLVTWGPFGFVRNPLYLGNCLIGLGWSLMSGLVPVLFFCGAFVFLYGFLIIPHEEAFLKERFGEEYLEYFARTPKLLPASFPGWDRLQGPFEPSRLWESERHSVYVTLVGTVLFFLKAKGVFLK